MKILCPTLSTGILLASLFVQVVTLETQRDNDGELPPLGMAFIGRSREQTQERRPRKQDAHSPRRHDRSLLRARSDTYGDGGLRPLNEHNQKRPERKSIPGGGEEEEEVIVQQESAQDPDCQLYATAECLNCIRPLDFEENDGLCSHPPTSISMLFRGGNCAFNAFSQPVMDFTCQDFPDNGVIPAQYSQDETYIVAYGADSGDVYFTGQVEEGGFYVLENGGQELDAHHVVEIYASQDGLVDQNQDTLLQRVTFSAGCAQPTDLLLNVFGASQVVEFVNSDGEQSFFVNADESGQVFDVAVTVELPLTLHENVILGQVSVRTNYTADHRLDFDELQGTVLSPEHAQVQVTFKGQWMSTMVPQTYTTIINVQGATESKGEVCGGLTKVDFVA